MSRRRIVGVAAAAGLALSTVLIGSVPAGADPKASVELRTALEAAPDHLQTAFEQSGGRTFTSQPQAVRFLRDLDAGSERVRVQTIGRTKQNRPLQLVQVGDPVPRSQAEAAKGSVVMVVCSVHGDEPSGREACLQLARDLAFTTDPMLVRFLSQTTVLFINANPDGWVADTRGNSDGTDVNRDYLAVVTPEARAVTKTIRDWNPDILNDLHEYGPREFYDTHLLHLWSRNRNVDPQIHALAQTMSHDFSAAQVISAGYTAGVYGQLVKDGEPFQQVAGDGQGRILRNYAGLVNVVGMLSETANEPLDDEEQADVSVLNKRRVAVNYTSAVGSVQMMIENRDRLAREGLAAAQRNTQAGRDRSGVVYFAGQDDMIPTAGNQVEPHPMCGYQLTADQWTRLRSTLALHEISSRTSGGGRFVTLGQPNRGLIPLLLDQRSEHRIAEATPVTAC